MKFTVKSKRLGTITFSRPGSSYVFVDTNGEPGCLGRQICACGRFSGSTLSYCGEGLEAFEKLCKKWLADYNRYERKHGFNP